jgi:Holliday junction resolvase-like predicted endonuclease
MSYVTKADGTTQPFDRQKVIQTCLRLRSTREKAENVADRIEGELHDGISTQEIIGRIYRYLAEYRPQVRYEADLRQALALLRPKPDFEQYVARLLREYGYNTVGPLILRGRCVEHEIDCIACRGGEAIYVEVKHHASPHIFTGLDIFLQAKATFQDLVEGYTAGLNKISIQRAMVVCNTKLSDHARQYASCAQIEYICWKSPPERSLEKLIEERKLYPITMLKMLDRETEEKLGDAGIFLLRELLDLDKKELSTKTGIRIGQVEELAQWANKVVE